MGEGIIEATITRWLVSPGDEVSEDQSIVEIATDKVDSEIPSPTSGKIKELLFAEGDTPQVGQVIAVIETEAKDEQTSETKSTSQIPPKEEEPSKEPKIKKINEHEEGNTNEAKSTLHLSPLVRSITKKEGISDDEIANLKGSGLGGRITRDDILAYIDKRNSITEKPKAVQVNNDTKTAVVPKNHAAG